MCNSQLVFEDPYLSDLDSFFDQDFLVTTGEISDLYIETTFTSKSRSGERFTVWLRQIGDFYLLESNILDEALHCSFSTDREDINRFDLSIYFNRKCVARSYDYDMDTDQVKGFYKHVHITHENILNILKNS